MFPLSRRHLAVVTASLLAGGVTMGRYWQRRTEPPRPVTITSPSPSPVRTVATVPAGPPMYVHVSGHVGKPGVYRLPAGSRIIDAVSAAGGPAVDAYVEDLNLASPLRDGDRLYVPTVGDLPPAQRPSYVTGPETAPEPPPKQEPAPELPADLTPPDDTVRTTHATPEPDALAPEQQPPSRSAAGSSGSKLHNPGEGTVNINSASASDLERLPGVGPSTAGKIIDYREQNGGFRTVEELMEVRGIGPKKLEKMRPFVTVN